VLMTFSRVRKTSVSFNDHHGEHIPARTSCRCPGIPPADDQEREGPPGTRLGLDWLPLTVSLISGRRSSSRGARCGMGLWYHVASALRRRRLDCISLPIPPAIGHQTANPFAPSPSDPPVPTHDFWLVIKFTNSGFELPLIPSQQMHISRTAGEIGYSIPSNELEGASLLLRFPAPKDGVEIEEIQSLEGLLYQYGCLDRDVSALGGIPGTEPADQPADMRGKLVLINEDSGQVLGEIDQSLDIEEDGKVGEDGREKQPVVLDFGAVVHGQMAGEVVVKTVPEDELDDWMLKGAHYLRFVFSSEVANQV
jgi:hypothetical protein